MWPTDFAPKVKRAVKAAFNAARAEINRGDLRKALTLKNYHSVEESLDGPVTAMQAELTKSLPPLLAECRDQAGKISYGKLQARLTANTRLRTALDLIQSGAFDVTAPSALAWVQAHAAETIQGIADTTREDIRAAIEESFSQQFDVEELTNRIEEIIGDDERADNIARTETMTASNAGQQEAWNQAVEDGLLTGNEEQEWIVTPDDRLCPECDALDGARAKIGEPFISKTGDQYDGAPAHPRCRCVLGLVT